ncbi:MAG: hypothetical protein LBI55_02030 [Oscillospiraceae bacterium]|jgi:hypothetical protein|nr:hypothetical protein [Oscillospiraceae bacterium]
MGLMENAFLGAKSIFSRAGKGAEKLVGVSRLKMNAAEINSQISSKLEELGKVVYTNCKSKKSNQDEIENLIKAIDELHIEYQEVKKRIAVIKKKIECKKCGYVNENDSAFCAQCGSKLSVFEVSNLQREMKKDASRTESSKEEDAGDDFCADEDKNKEVVV